MGYHAGEEYAPLRLSKCLTFKNDVSILFGDNYSFDHPEYYLTRARARTYMDQCFSYQDFANLVSPKESLLEIWGVVVFTSLRDNDK